MTIQIDQHYNSLEKIKQYLTSKTQMDLSIVQDQWVTDDSLTLTPGKQCLVVKKSGTAGAKVNVLESGTIDVHPIPPSTFINNLTQRGILALIVHNIISGSQKAVAKEVLSLLQEIKK